MKFQVSAISLGFACEAYIADMGARGKIDRERIIASFMLPKPSPPKEEITFAGWWFWRKKNIRKIPQPDTIMSREEAEKQIWRFGGRFKGPLYTKALQWQIIAAHKQPLIMFEVTDEEIGDIALYLPADQSARRI